MKNKFLSRIGQWHTPPYLRKCLTSLKSLTLLLMMLMSVNVWGEDEVAYTITYTKGTSDSGTATPSIATQKDKDGTDGSFATLSANSYAYARTNGLHLSSGKSAGNATLTLSDDGKVVASKIVTNALAKSNKSFSIEVTFTDNTKQTATFTPGISTTDCTLTISDANASKTIKSIYYSAGSGTGTGIASTTVYTAAASTKTALDQVSNLSAGTPSATSATISWTGISDSELDGYKVEYKVKSAAAWTVATSKTTETSFTLTGLTPSTEYAYQITSVAKSTSTTKKDSDPQAGTNFTTAAPQKYYAHFYVNGTENETFKQYLAEGAAITMPNEVDAPSTCSDKVFVGWVGEANKDYKSEDTAPDYITNPTMGSTDVNFYAVFADEEGGGSATPVTVSATFKGSGEGGNSCTSGYGLTLTKTTNKAGYIQDNASTNEQTVIKVLGTSAIFSVAQEKIEVKATLGGGTTKDDLTEASQVYCALLDKNGNNIAGTQTVLTKKITDTGGSEFSVEIPTSATSSAYGFTIYHTKLAGYNVRYYSANLTATPASTTYSDFVTSCVVDDRTPVKMTGFTADETTLLKGATTNTSVTNDQTGWTAAYTYSSDKPEVATVNESGVITAVSKGMANITATLNVAEDDPTYKADDANKSKSIEITVNNPKVAVNFFVNGTQLTSLDESLTSQEEGAVLACPANPSDIGSKVFVGWKLGEISGSTDDEPELVSSSTLVGNAEQNYHAVFATKGVSTSDYVKGSLSDLTTGQKVVIVEYTDKMALTSTATDDTYNLKNKSVTINNNKISSVAGELVWDVTKINDSKYQFKQGDSFLYGYNDGQNHYNLKFGSTSDSWTIASGGTGYTLESGLCSGYKLEYFNSKFTIYKKDALDKAFYMDFYIPDVEYTAYVTTIASEYAITVDGSIANGSVEASAASAVAGSTIELTATPAGDAYDFDAWNVYKTDEPATKVTVTDNKFEMPNYAVTVSATFKATDRALITWNSFGTEFAQTYVSREGKIQMPTGTPTNESGCSSKYQYFMGWSTAIDGVATEAPTYITAETAAPTENTTYYAVFAKGQEGTDVKKLTFPDDNKDNNSVSGYSKTWTAKNGSDSWSVVNFNNNNWTNWTYIKCGSKSAASVATIATDFAFSEAIKKVIVNANISEEKLNTAKLYVSSNSDFTSATTVALSMGQTSAATDFEFVIPTPAANQYYKLEFDCQQSSNNGFLQINSIAYKTADIYEGYATTCPSAYAITVSQPEQGGSIGASVTSAEAGETVTLTANPATGYTTGTWDVYKTGESATKETVTDNAFTMPAYPVTVEYAFTEIKVTSITLNKTEYTMDANSAFQLEVTEILPADALNKEVEWSTSDASIATVSETGLVSGAAASATPVVITATSKSDNTVTATCSFTITDPIVWNLTGITVTKPTITTFAEGVEFTTASLAEMVVTGQYENSIDPTETKDEPITEGYTVKIGEHELPYTITHEDALAGTMKVTVTYNEQSDDFDLTLVPSYKTTWKVNGTAQTGATYPATADAENKITLPTATDEALVALFGDDQYQFFRGWATEELEEEATSETGIVYAQAGDEISEDKTYYAVFAKGEMAEGWNINTEAPAASESVVLAAKDNGTYYAFTADGSASSPVALTVEDGKITSENPFAWSVSVEDNKMYLKQSNNYVHFNSKSVIKVTTGTTNGVVTFTKSGDGFIMTGNNYTISFDKSLTEKQFYYKGADDEAAIFYVFKKDATTLTSFLTTKCDNKVPAPTIETVKTPTTITLNWAAVTGIDSWNVTFDGETTTVNTNTYKATGLEMESEHSYKVVAVPAGDYCGAIAASGSVSTIACNTPTPENLSVTDLTATTATLNWNAIDNAKYEVYVTDGSNEITKEVETNSYEVTGLTPNTKYTWSVKAFVECWGSDEDGEFTTLATVDKFNLTLNATNGEISSAPAAGLVEEGEDVVMEAINPAEGYMFGSWSYTGLTEADVEIDENTLSFTMPHGDVTVTANFIEIPTITWKVCGETVATTPATNGKVGTVQDAPTTWKYDNQFKYFAGWVKGENVETPVYATADMPIIENTTFNAAFSKGRKAQYQLVTDVDNLAADDELVIVGLKTNGNVYYAAGEIPSTKDYLNAIEIDAPENNIITVESDEVLVFTLGGETNAWTFKANDKYLSSTGTKANKWDGDYKTWKLANSSTDNMVVMKSVQYTSGVFEFNMGSPRFRNYEGSQEDLYFYRYSGSIYENLTIDPQPDYGRTDLVVGNYGTVCVPYAVKVADRSGATFWNIETSSDPGSASPTSVTIRQEEGDLVAGKPYIFCAEGTTMAMFFSGDKYEEMTSVDANGLYGNLTDGTIIINQTEYVPGYFFVLQQKLYECGVNCTVGVNRGWVQAEDIQNMTTPSPAPRRVIGNPKGTPTGINDLNTDDWKNIQGARKYLHNNHIIIVNEGRIFNAQGQLVK